MITEICKRELCTGCMACVQLCTHKAILIVQDEQGFDRPVISADKCVECGLCVRFCPVNKPALKYEAIDIYSGWSKNEEVRCNSASGGAFSEIARPVLESGGVVFGCAMNENNEAVHTYVETWDDLATKLRGSKYVQSKIGESYKQTKDFLKQGREVLFSGTPCQIAGLRNYLCKDYPNLTTVDLVCHGVPSPRVFKDYICYQEYIHKDKITHINFRSKQYSWNYYGMILSFRNNSRNYYGAYYDDPYIRGFLRDFFLRPSCNLCQYTSTKRVSDFTIADWWGYKPLKGENDIYKKGVSLILVNTIHGQGLVNRLNMQLRKRNIAEALKTNICLYKPFPSNPKRQEFWRDYKTLSFSQVLSKYMYPEKVGWKIKYLQSHPNTDKNIKLMQFLMLPQRIWNRLIYIMQIEK